MKATATAPSNIAFIKYWGKMNDALRLPLNSSFSMNLSGTQTTTTVEFSSANTKDRVTLLPGALGDADERAHFSEQEISRIVAHMDRIRQRAGSHIFATIATQNSFPKSTGAASSASGFAALTVAASAALHLNMTEKELTILARIGSGSACRSIPDGFVQWDMADSSELSYAHSLYSSTYWDLRDILVIVDHRSKKVSTSDGMNGVSTSPLLPQRLQKVPARIEAMKKAFQEKNFTKAGVLLEEDCLDMHRVMQSQTPPLYYWNDVTEKFIEAVVSWRNSGLEAYFTIDAGPNIHLICEAKNEARVLEKIHLLRGVQSVIVNKPAPGAHCIDNHLF